MEMINLFNFLNGNYKIIYNCNFSTIANAITIFFLKNYLSTCT